MVHPVARLLVRLALLAALVVATCALISNVNLPQNTYVDALIDKQGRLEALPPGKIILVGGSGLAFGVDSSAIAAALHRPIVNMGVHGRFGLQFMLQQVQPYIAANDIIVLSPEYELFFGRQEINPEMCRAISDLPGALSMVGLRRLAVCEAAASVDRVQENSMKMFRRAARLREPQTVYSRDGFNQAGDFVAHLDKPSTYVPAPFSDVPSLGGVEQSAIDTINAFAAQAAARRATVIMVYPAYMDLAWSAQSSSINNLDRLLRERLGRSVIIASRPADFVFPREQFYDTIYHLNRTGRELRTSKLIRVLVQAIPSLKPVS